jgi:hypothetical protein
MIIALLITKWRSQADVIEIINIETLLEGTITTALKGFFHKGQVGDCLSREIKLFEKRAGSHINRSFSGGVYKLRKSIRVDLSRRVNQARTFLLAKLLLGNIHYRCISFRPFLSAIIVLNMLKEKNTIKYED